MPDWFEKYKPSTKREYKDDPYSTYNEDRAAYEKAGRPRYKPPKTGAQEWSDRNQARNQTPIGLISPYDPILAEEDYRRQLEEAYNRYQRSIAEGTYTPAAIKVYQNEVERLTKVYQGRKEQLQQLGSGRAGVPQGGQSAPSSQSRGPIQSGTVTGNQAGSSAPWGDFYSQGGMPRVSGQPTQVTTGPGTTLTNLMQGSVNDTWNQLVRIPRVSDLTGVVPAISGLDTAGQRINDNRGRTGLQQDYTTPRQNPGDWMRYEGNDRRYGLSDVNWDRLKETGDPGSLNEYGQPLGTLAPYKTRGKNLGHGGRYKKRAELYRYGYRGNEAAGTQQAAAPGTYAPEANPTRPGWFAAQYPNGYTGPTPLPQDIEGPYPTAEGGNPYPIAIDYGTMGQGLTGGQTIYPSQTPGWNPGGGVRISAGGGGNLTKEEAWYRRNLAMGKMGAVMKQERARRRKASKAQPQNQQRSQAPAPQQPAPGGFTETYQNPVVNWNW